MNFGALLNHSLHCGSLELRRAPSPISDRYTRRLPPTTTLVLCFPAVLGDALDARRTFSGLSRSSHLLRRFASLSLLRMLPVIHGALRGLTSVPAPERRALRLITNLAVFGEHVFKW